jgi:hypothetical protein
MSENRGEVSLNDSIHTTCHLSWNEDKVSLQRLRDHLPIVFLATE